MKLRQKEIEIIAKHVTDSLIENGFVEADDPEDLCAGINKVIHDELHLEDELNDEVRKILEEHSSDIMGSKVEYHRVFNLVKHKLIKERNLIL